MLGGICSSSSGIPSMSGPYSKRDGFRSLSGHDGWGRQLSKRCIQSRKTLDSRLRGNGVGGCTRRTVVAFLGEFLVRARAGVNKRNARTHEFLLDFVGFCRIVSN